MWLPSDTLFRTGINKHGCPTCSGQALISMAVLLFRTAEQVGEEEVLVAELRKIELRKKERERKQQDLQKLISAAEQNMDRWIPHTCMHCVD